jgi:hypothetical protein
MRFGSSARTRTWNSSADELTARVKVLPDPIPAPAAFQFSLTAHGLTAGLKLLLIHQLPRPRVTLGVKSPAIVGIVVFGETAAGVAALSNVNLSPRINQDVNPEHGRPV